jgi:hypothetical protein
VRGRAAATGVGKIAIQPGGSKPPVPMSSHVVRARIGKIGVLRSIVVPAEVVSALGGAARIPVIARYAGETIKSTLVPAGGPKRRLVLQMDLLRPAKLDAGDTIEVALAADTGPRRPMLPPDLQRALQFRPAAAAELDRESPSTWRMVIGALESSRTPETRQRRLEKIIEHLAENAANRATKK